MAGQRALAAASCLNASTKGMVENKFTDLMAEYATLRQHLAAALSGDTGHEIDESLASAASLAATVQREKKTLAALIKAAS